MENPIYIALSRQEALRRQLDVVSNNVANMNTPGFKQQRMLFLEYLSKPAPAPAPKLSMVQDYGVMRDTRPGPISHTANQLDLALQGDGYFAVETIDGQHYTRVGRFQLNNDRQIVDANGLPLLDDGDRPITVPQNAGRITIAGDGAISTEQGQLGQLKLVRFERDQYLDELGGGLYATNEPALPAEDARVVQGAVEDSNVQPVVEMTQMMEIMRQYQSNQRLIETEHERQRNAITKLARLS
jgi:flagellar basal-body rod protein FlgF